MSIFEAGSEMASINWIMCLGTVLVLLISPAESSHSRCPSVCLCKWKSGKQTVECVDQSLDSIPSGIQNGAQVLDLRRNNLRRLPTRVFLQNGLTNLQKIYMPRCNITAIADDAFHQVTNLVELDLSWNLLNAVPAQTFKDFPLLRRLQLGNNPIQRIKNGTFVQLPHLTFLELSNCEIQTIEPEAFKDLKNLEFIMLDNNKIKTISVNVVKPLNKLYGLDLQKNPWYCDCNLRGVREWMMENNIPLNFEPKCDLPARIHGEVWNNLQLDDFSCPPVIHCEEEIQVQRYHNGTLVCQVESNPEAIISWAVNGVDINNGSVIAWDEKYFIEEEEADDEDTKSGRLIVIRVNEEDSGYYTCSATNSAGTTLANITLSVVLPPVPLMGWSNAQIAGFVVGIFLFIVLIVVLICIVTIRRRVLSTSDSKLGGVGFLKHLAYVKQNSVEVKNDKEITANDKNLRRETGSSGYGSDQQTPDLVSRAMEIDGPSIQKPSNHVDCEETWNMNKLRSSELEWLNNRVGRYVPPSTAHYLPHYINDADYVERTQAEPSDTGSFRDESYHSYTSPVHNNWKRSPLVLPNNAYLSLTHDMHCCSPDEGYDEGALEGTEV